MPLTCVERLQFGQVVVNFRFILGIAMVLAPFVC